MILYRATKIVQRAAHSPLHEIRLQSIIFTSQKLFIEFFRSIPRGYVSSTVAYPRALLCSNFSWNCWHCEENHQRRITNTKNRPLKKNVGATGGCVPASQLGDIIRDNRQNKQKITDLGKSTRKHQNPPDNVTKSLLDGHAPFNNLNRVPKETPQALVNWRCHYSENR